MICNKYIIEVAENVHEHDQSQSHLWEIDKCLNQLLIYMKPKIDSTGVEGQLPLSTLNFFVLQELRRSEHVGVCKGRYPVKKWFLSGDISMECLNDVFCLAIFCRKPPKDCFSVSRMFLAMFL